MNGENSHAHVRSIIFSDEACNYKRLQFGYTSAERWQVPTDIMQQEFIKLVQDAKKVYKGLDSKKRELLIDYCLLVYL